MKEVAVYFLNSRIASVANNGTIALFVQILAPPSLVGRWLCLLVSLHFDKQPVIAVPRIREERKGDAGKGAGAS